MKKISEDVYVGIAAMMLFSYVGSLNAQQRLIPAGCPAAVVQKKLISDNRKMTSERAASDKLVEEGQAATRTLKGDHRWKDIKKQAGW